MAAPLPKPPADPLHVERGHEAWRSIEAPHQYADAEVWAHHAADLYRADADWRRVRAAATVAAAFAAVEHNALVAEGQAYGDG